LSWFLGEYRGERIIKHGGGDTGFRSHFIMLPDMGTSVVVLCNMYPAPVEEISHSALDIILGFEPDPVIPLASLIVYKTLNELGLDAAVEKWNSLKLDHPEEYDFNPQQFSNLFVMIDLGRIKDAVNIARLCARILPEPEMKDIEDAIEESPKMTAPVILKAIREHRN